ncbi:MAG TPA: gliding motility protein [Aquifex aeolicus]|uniref:Gliding motility protein n=1 Tax=Aquifex aeolicus TaxID=63363 RepID=A0A7C5QIB3_AQUAO|nr:gliding motility protein [Aquifex aeolicus]
MKLKVVYFGASLAGKSTNVRILYEKLRSRGVTKGDYISMETDENRTLFVEMFLSSFRIEDQDIDVKVLTTPGQFRLHPLRKVIMKGVDGLVFVVDSSKERENINFLVLRETAAVLKEQGYDLYALPVVVQYNKRDLPDALPIEELQPVCNPWGTEFIEAVAPEGLGVVETFRAIVRRILTDRVASGSGRIPS